VVNNECLLLVEEAVEPDKLNRSDLEEKMRACEQEAERAEEGSEEKARHERDARRYKAFIEIAGSSSS
jgi:F0F1-type ATP synthase epsilon subunit